MHELGVDPPCYVRKVDRSLIGGDENDPPNSRADRIRSEVLSIDDGVLSVFYITNAQDVIRVACALTFARAIFSEMSLLAFTPEELSSVGKDQTPDTFECHWARRNHWDLTFREEDKLRIANLLAEQNRKAKRFFRAKIKAAWDAGGHVGCRSVRDFRSHAS